MSLAELAYTVAPFADLAVWPYVLNTEAKKDNKEVNPSPPKQNTSIDELHKKLEDPKVEKSFDCMEGVPQEASTTKKQINFIRDEIPKYGLTVASTMHVLASLSKAFKFLPQSFADFLHLNSTRLSKAFNFVNYTVKGVDALKHNRSWDALGRLAYSAIVPFQDQEDLFLSSGLSSGITMFEQGQRHKVPNADKPKSLAENFGQNFSAFPKMISEIIQGGLGKNRKIFIHEDKEKGHTMFLGALGNFSGALLGLFSGKGKSPLKKIATIIRNVGGIVCDWGKIVSPEINNKISGFTYLAVSILDVAQSWAPEPLASTISHLSLAINNVANYFYVNTSKSTSDGTFQDFKGNQSRSLRASRTGSGDKGLDDYFSVNLARTSPRIRPEIVKSAMATAV